MLKKPSFFRFAMELMFGEDPRERRRIMKAKPFRSVLKIGLVLVACSAPWWYSSYHTYYNAHGIVLEKLRKTRTENEELKKEIKDLKNETNALKEDVRKLTDYTVRMNNSSGKVETKLYNKESVKKLPKETNTYDRKSYLIENLNTEEVK